MWFLSYCPFWLLGSLAGNRRVGSFALVVLLPLPCSDIFVRACDVVPNIFSFLVFVVLLGIGGWELCFGCVIASSLQGCKLVCACGISRPRGYKLCSCSTQLSIKFIPLINVKMPTIVVGILTFISMINTTSERLKAIIFFTFWNFSVYEVLKFRVHLS